VSEPRYLVSDPSGATWHYRITPVVRGKAGASVTVEGASKQAPSVADLVAQQVAIDAEILARTQGDLQTALDAAADAQVKADAALANAGEQTDAALAQALAAASAALATATAQTDALAAEVAEIVNAPEWEADHEYITGWLVRHNGALYRATEESTGQPPDQHPDIWEHLGQYSSVAGIAAAALSSATTNASDLAAEAARINALVARMPGGNGKLATQASVSAEQSARATGDAANATAIQAVNATVAGKADASALSAVTTRVEGLETCYPIPPSTVGRTAGKDHRATRPGPRLRLILAVTTIIRRACIALAFTAPPPANWTMPSAGGFTAIRPLP